MRFFLLPFAAAGLLPIVTVAAPPFSHVIASQAASDEDSSATWFDSLPLYHVPDSDAPTVPSNDPNRDMVFGAPLTFSVFPLNPASNFSLTLLFLDDATSYHRSLSLAVGGGVVAPRIDLPPKVVYNATFIIGGGVVKPLPDSGGALGFGIALAALSGPNAVLSSFSLASSNPADPPIFPPRSPVPTHALPRLTPRPASVAGTDAPIVDLNGAWDFDPTGAGAAFPATLTVPGEYTLQGFRIPEGQPVVYRRAFSVPAAWAGLRAKLRFDGVSSNATVFVNGALAGTHLGGFTPFELDVTAALVPGGANMLTVVVVGWSVADDLASASKYATHDIGGITRKVYLMAVPPVSIADVHVVTTFTDGTRTAADVFLNVSLANDGEGATGAPTTVDVGLAFNGAAVTGGQVTFPADLPPGTVAFAALTLRVPAPRLWDPEHPQLHDLTLTLPTQTVVRRVGIRDVRVVGNRVVVNGRPIKARGTTRHEVHPLVGRALWALEPVGKQWERDIIAFRDANVNYIRTSHYPPAEELMEAADELGMLLEVEMPFCWASGNVGAFDFNYTVQAQREAMVFLRNHPSVVHWSLGNESPWLRNFDQSLALYLREVDWTRPFLFDGGGGQAIPPLDIISLHYPGFDVPPKLANASYPTQFGEYAHLNCYNRRELAADPGVRDIWGLGIEKMWELIYASPGVLGACYWAGIDEYVSYARPPPPPPLFLRPSPPPNPPLLRAPCSFTCPAGSPWATASGA